MKVLYSFLFLALLHYPSVAQKIIEANYSLILSENKESKLDKMLIESMGDFRKVAREMEFTLIFAKEKSYFAVKEKLYTQESLAEIALLRANYNGRTIQEKMYSYTEYDSELYPQKVILKKEIPTWKLSSEKKSVSGFECYKAHTTYTVINSAGTFNNIVEAWYCPEINFSFGPLGYGGLPGLIFELKIKDAVYGLTNLDFNPITKEAPNLKKYAIVSQKELDQKAIEAYENFIEEKKN